MENWYSMHEIFMLIGNSRGCYVYLIGDDCFFIFFEAFNLNLITIHTPQFISDHNDSR